MPNVSWQDIGGLENVKRELQEVSFSLMIVMSCHTSCFVLHYVHELYIGNSVFFLNLFF